MACASIDQFLGREREIAARQEAASTSLLELVQANAGTLKSVTKRKVYCNQFSRASIHIVGTQETRLPTTGINILNDYILVQSAALPSGSGGCLLAISRKLPFAVERPDCQLSVSVTDKDVSILDCSSRCLYVRLHAPRVQMLLFVIHGLDSSYGEVEVAMFWDNQFTRLSSLIKLNEAVLGFIDGNCRIGQSCDGGLAFGDALSSDTQVTFVSHAFATFCRKAQLLAPTTFMDNLVHKTPLTSFWSSTGLKVPCDYVVNNSHVAVQPVSVHTWDTFYMDNKKPDHVPIRFRATVTCTTSLPVAKRRVSAYNRQAVRDAALSTDLDVIMQIEKLDIHLQHIPRIPLCFEPTTHRRIVADYIIDGLSNIFPVAPVSIRKTWMSNQTFSLVQELAVVKHTHGIVGCMLKSACIWFVVQVWKGHVFHGFFVPWWNSVRGPCSKHVCMRQVRLRKRLAVLNEFVAEGIEADLAEWLVSQCRKLEEAALETNSRRLFHILRSMKAWTPPRNFRLTGPDGLPSSSHRAERQVVQEHFGGKLHAHASTMCEVIDEEREYARVALPSRAAVAKSLDAVPTLTFCVSKNAKGRLRGTSDIVIGGEVGRLVPRSYAAALHPLHVKTSMYMRNPVQFLSNVLHELWKGSGAQSNVEMYRDISLVDGDGKTF